MTFIIRKMLAWLKNHQTYLEDNIFKFYFNRYNKLKNIRNLFRLEK